MYTLKTTMYLLNRFSSKACRKPNLRHLHVWGCLAEVRIYNPHEKKLDSRTTSDFFIGYPKKSRGYRFYYLNHNTRIVEIGNARFIENGEVSRNEIPCNVIIQEVRVQVPLPITYFKVDVPPIVEQFNNYQKQQMNDFTTHNNDIVDEPTIDEP